MATPLVSLAPRRGNASGRPPGLREGMLDAAETLPFVAKHAGWYMTRVPAALLADEPLPEQ